MPARNYSSDNYRYGFNGKEKDKDINSLNAYDYGFRIYNPAIGKFLSVDPLFKKFAWYTPYQYAGNKPTRFVDMDGLEEKDPNKNEFGNYTDAPTGNTIDKTPNIIKIDPKLDPVTKFGVGILKTAYYTFAAFTEEAGAMHYGSKVPKDKYAEEFPLVPNDNILKDIIIPSLTWPVTLVNEIKKDPTNTELWGEAFGSVFMGKFMEAKINVKAKIAERISLADKFLKNKTFLLINFQG